MVAPRPKLRSPELKIVRLGEPVPPISARQPMELCDYWFDIVSASAWYTDEREQLVVVLMSRYEVVQGFSLISVGDMNETICSPREVIRVALIGNCYGFSIMHNHPSGVPNPSKADKEQTARIQRAAALFGIAMFDHVIVGTPAHQDRQYFSFRESGLL